MENNLENKAMFFAQYYGQNVKRSYLPEQTSLQVIDRDVFWIGHLIINGYLELKSIEDITDEDALECTGVEVFKTYQSDENSGCYGMLPSGIFLDQEAFYITDRFNADYLRSKGYALPWMGLSIEKLIEYGWVKLKEK